MKTATDEQILRALADGDCVGGVWSGDEDLMFWLQDTGYVDKDRAATETLRRIAPRVRVFNLTGPGVSYG